MSVRSIIKVGKNKLYATRKKNGRFTSISNIGKSIKRDSAKKSKKVVKPGHGHEGDLKKKAVAKKKPSVKKALVKKPVAKKKSVSKKK